jgi:hypothetical protein
LFIENLFSTYLYTGNSSTQTITNGIDITGKGGLVWIKNRTNGTTYHILTDTARGAGLNISSNVSIAQYNDGQPTFNSTGFNLINSNIDYNTSANNYVSWTFREQTKFFDIVTYTGDGAASRNIAHNLGSVPGCIINKALSISENWGVYHRSTGANGLYLNATNSAGVTGVLTGQTSTTFEVGNGYGIGNSSGVTYVAYLFAHDAGGFGLTGTDNVISCASTTTDGSGNATVNLGYEPQWVLIKQTNAGGQNWILQDNMRGMFASGNAGSMLYPNATSADTGAGGPVLLTSTGFRINAYVTSSTIAYIAIRRGPMKTPTVGTSVFSPITSSAGSFTVGPTADATTEGAESFTVSVRTTSTSGTIIGTSSSITINDTSTAPVITTRADTYASFLRLALPFSTQSQKDDVAFRVSGSPNGAMLTPFEAAGGTLVGSSKFYTVCYQPASSGIGYAMPVVINTSSTFFIEFWAKTTSTDTNNWVFSNDHGSARE